MVLYCSNTCAADSPFLSDPSFCDVQELFWNTTYCTCLFKAPQWWSMAVLRSWHHQELLQNIPVDFRKPVHSMQECKVPLLMQIPWLPLMRILTEGCQNVLEKENPVLRALWSLKLIGWWQTMIKLLVQTNAIVDITRGFGHGHLYVVLKASHLPQSTRRYWVQNPPHLHCAWRSILPSQVNSRLLRHPQEDPPKMSEQHVGWSDWQILDVGSSTTNTMCETCSKVL